MNNSLLKIIDLIILKKRARILILSNKDDCQQIYVSASGSLVTRLREYRYLELCIYDSRSNRAWSPTINDLCKKADFFTAPDLLIFVTDSSSWKFPATICNYLNSFNVPFIICGPLVGDLKALFTASDCYDYIFFQQPVDPRKVVDYLIRYMSIKCKDYNLYDPKFNPKFIHYASFIQLVSKWRGLSEGIDFAKSFRFLKNPIFIRGKKDRIRSINP